MEHKSITDELYFCAGQCTRCHDACAIEKEKDKLKRCMQLDQDCAEICRLTGAFIERGSENEGLLLKLCAQVCERCAEECEKHSHMEHCKKCAEACRECAKRCHNFEPVGS